jgi:transposase
VLEEVAVDIVHPRVAGIDVHKKVVWVAVRLPGAGPGERTVTVRRFATFWRSLQQMATWLVELDVTDAAMEPAGVYWWPVYHALAQAGPAGVCVCNAAHMRNVPGRKTGVRDCQWIAELREHGLLRPSFIPGQQAGAAGTYPLPQEADRAPGFGGPAAVESTGGRRDQD